MGRHRDSSLDAAILAAAGDCIAETGLAAFTVEAVADRVGIPKSTLYKRWPSRSDLLSQVLTGWIEQLRPRRPAIPTGDIRAYLARLVEQEIHVCRTRSGRAFAQLVLATYDADIPTPASPLTDAARARRETMRTAVTDAIAAGTLTDTIRPDVLLDLLLGAIWGSALAGELPRRAHAQQLVDAVLDRHPGQAPGR